MTGGPPAPSRHPSSRPPSLPPSISLECPDGDSAVTPHLSIPVRQMPWTQAAAKKPASSSFSFSADPGGSGRWPSGPRVAQVLPVCRASRCCSPSQTQGARVASAASEMRSLHSIPL